MSPINRICCIIDLDGFNFRAFENNTMKNEFLIRELGFVRIDPEFGPLLPQSYRFDLTSYDFSKCKDSWNTIHYQTRHVTGLRLKPQSGEFVHRYEDRFNIMRNIYKFCQQPALDIVAYKSGIFEKDFLDEMGIPSLDLSHYGCPKYEDLVRRKMIFSNLFDCGYHTGISNTVKLLHCPMAEVTAFRDWLLFEYPQG